MRFRKRPVVIEAHRWRENGDHPEDECKLILRPNGTVFLSEGKVVRYYRVPGMDGLLPCQQCGRVMHEHGWIDAPAGGHVVCPDDWIVTGANGEHYPVKPDLFDKTYEVAP
jgi:hypothetical protein